MTGTQNLADAKSFITAVTLQTLHIPSVGKILLL